MTAVADERTWPRAAGLLFLTLMLSLFTGPGVLVAFPFLALTMVLGLRRLPAAVAAVFAMFVAVGVPTRGGLWYFERGWAFVLAGWFVVLTMRWPQSRFFPRALTATASSTPQPKRTTKVTARFQRDLGRAIKRARYLALIPYIRDHEV